MSTIATQSKVQKGQINLTPITTIVGLGSVIIGIIATLHSIRRFTRARKLSIFLEYNKKLDDLEFIKQINEIQSWSWENVEDFFDKYGPESDPDAFAKFTRVGSYFDGLATLVQRKFMDYDFIPETTAISLISFWEKFAPDAEVFATWIRVVSYFDGLSTLVHKKFIDAEFIPESTAIMLIRHYELLKPTMDEFAMVYRRPNCYDSVKFLYDKIQKIDYQYDREGYEKLLKKIMRTQSLIRRKKK